MKKLIFILICFISFPVLSFADRDGNEYIYIRKKENGGHIEYNTPADMPEVYLDTDEMEIVIEADGFASYYNVDIVFVPTSTLVISTQISGYGDSIDISSLSSGYYCIVITSEYNNVYQGYFTIV